MTIGVIESRHLTFILYHNILEHPFQDLLARYRQAQTIHILTNQPYTWILGRTMTTPFLPSTLPLFPLPPSQLLFPHLSITTTIPGTHLAVVLNSIAENVKTTKGEDGSRMVAVVPVYEIDRRVGRWACGESLCLPSHTTRSAETFREV